MGESKNLDDSSLELAPGSLIQTNQLEDCLLVLTSQDAISIFHNLIDTAPGCGHASKIVLGSGGKSFCDFKPYKNNILLGMTSDLEILVFSYSIVENKHLATFQLKSLLPNSE